MADVDAWMPIWIGDYLADTQELTTEEHGAYLLLLMTAWRSGGRLPAAPERLARITKLGTKAWAETWKALGRFFRVDGDELVQGRLELELAEAERKRTAASERGRKGAAAKHCSSTAQALLKQTPGTAQAELKLKPSPSPPLSLRSVPSQPPDPDPPEETDQDIDPAREAKFTAPQEFEAFWSAIESNRPKGSKIRAVKSWIKGGKPAADLMVRKWRAYRLSIGDSFALDVVTWLNIPGWLEDWEPAPVAPVRAPVASPYRNLPPMAPGVPPPPRPRP